MTATDQAGWIRSSVLQCGCPVRQRSGLDRIPRFVSLVMMLSNGSCTACMTDERAHGIQYSPAIKNRVLALPRRLDFVRHSSGTKRGRSVVASEVAQAAGPAGPCEAVGAQAAQGTLRGLGYPRCVQLVAVETSCDAVVGEGISGESPGRTHPIRRLLKHQSLWLALVAIAGGRFGHACGVESPARSEVNAFTARRWNLTARRLTRWSKATQR